MLDDTVYSNYSREIHEIFIKYADFRYASVMFAPTDVPNEHVRRDDRIREDNAQKTYLENTRSKRDFGEKLIAQLSVIVEKILENTVIPFSKTYRRESVDFRRRRQWKQNQGTAIERQIWPKTELNRYKRISTVSLADVTIIFLLIVNQKKNYISSIELDALTIGVSFLTVNETGYRQT